MFIRKKKVIGFITAILTVVLCLGSLPANAESYPSEFAQEFANPTDSVSKLKARYWLPTGFPASTPERLAEVDREMAEMAAAGYSGVEISNVYEGMTQSEYEALKQGDGESSYLYGSKYYTETVKQILKSAKKYGMTVDFTSGTHWPSASDQVDVTSDAVVKELVYSVTELQEGEVFTELQEDIVAMTNADVDSPKELLGVYAAKFTDVTDGQYTLVDSTLEKLEELNSGDYSYVAPDDDYVIIEIYQRSTGATIKYASYNNPETNYTGYTLCSFSAAGTEEWIRYFEEEVFDDEIRALLKEVGANFFEDNFSFNAQTTWSADYLENFSTLRGYDLTEVLPYVLGMSHAGHSSRTSSTNIDLDKSDLGFVIDGEDEYKQNQVLGDYVQTFSELYNTNHVDAIMEWAEQYDMGFRVQTYGSLIDTGLTASRVSVPEGEEIGFSNQYDNFRQLAAGRDMGGNTTILSSEFGASFSVGGPYGYTFDAMLKNIYKNYAAGVNNLFLHGYSYAYSPEAVWPGSHAFGTTCSGTWSSRDPQWTHVLDWSGHISRMQYTLNQGVQKTDIAIYNSHANSQIRGPYYTDTGLTEAGYSYQFITKGLLTLDSAKVTNGRLNETGPAYKAIVLRNETAVPLYVIEKLGEYAANGLPVFFVGNIPQISTTLTETSESVAAAMNTLLAKENVYQVETEAQLVAALAAQNVAPDVKKASSNKNNENLITIHRSMDDDQIYYMYNESTQEQNYTLTLNGNGVPFILDCWTGEITPVGSYTTDGESVTLNITLAATDAAIIGISAEDTFGTAPSVYAVDSTHKTTYQNNKLTAKISKNGTYSFTTNEGNVYSGNISSIPAPIEINNWNLQVTSWTSADANDPLATDKSVIFNGSVPAASWTEIEGIGGTVSGIGVYKATFTLDDASNLGAYLDFTEIHDSYRVTLNGKQLPASNIVSDSVDLGGYLVSGENELVLEVASSLQNAHNAAQGKDPGKVYGIIGSTTITPYYMLDVAQGPVQPETPGESESESESETAKATEAPAESDSDGQKDISDTSDTSDTSGDTDPAGTGNQTDGKGGSGGGKSGTAPKTGDETVILVTFLLCAASLTALWTGIKKANHK